ncbi:hypothetical protein [Hydrogenivirga sp. 128-5-R1-1]|uniref:hypothetical protein n=1 Tax=Hydrogenivirga sp. 128-5-R1-1 TaxID=392423 RepID=UPI00015F1855|nr:hypothetical protein [Hydrogenivirga sp. 128-5-R1-1]EDP75498.1 hypothetical protein HG1285_16076 [Hydrogenivirga sp. 128-5-R1-1]
MKEEAIRERIKFYTELLKALILLDITTAGGIAGLLFKADESPAVFLLLIGSLLEVFFLAGTLSLYLTIEELLRRLET